MDAVSEFRSRREKRLAARGIYPDSVSRIIAYAKRREGRLDDRGYRADADGDEEKKENNNNNGGGGHGNTKLPFGLCMRFGIDIGKDWTPRDAWDALAGKGITPDGAFDKLKKGEDPGTPDSGSATKSASRSVTVSGTGLDTDIFDVSGAVYKDGKLELRGYASTPDMEGSEVRIKEFSSKGDLMRFLKEQGVEEFPDPDTGEIVNPKELEIPKDPVKKVAPERYSGAEYEHLTGRKRSWVSRGDKPWELSGDMIGESESGYWPPKKMRLPFMTKTDMLEWLKEQGVEEFADPETGEIINPKEMELPKKVGGWLGIGYTALALGLRDGRYTVTGTDYEGKKRKLDDFGSFEQAKAFIEGKAGGKMEDVKMSPALKKREAERTAWLSSDKKEYFEVGGTKYGDVTIGGYPGNWSLIGEDEHGNKKTLSFTSKPELMKYLQEQGVESVKDNEGKRINPMEEKIPEAKFHFLGRDYVDAGIYAREGGSVYFFGNDMDGQRRALAYFRSTETPEDFIKRIENTYGISRDQLTMSDETKEELDRLTKEKEEEARRIAEFEAKATEVPGRGKFTDIHIGKDDYYDEYRIYGYGPDGKKKAITVTGDMYDMDKYAERYGLDVKSLIKDEKTQKDWDDYENRKKKFEAKAIDIAGDKYTDVTVKYEGGMFKVSGYDGRGRMKEFSRESSYEDLENTLGQYGYTPDSFPMDYAAKEYKDKAMKAKAALASGDYYSLGMKDKAYKGIRAEETTKGEWKIYGTDPDDKEEHVLTVKSWDDAVKRMNDYGVSDYSIKDKSGAEMKKPSWGMHKVMLMKKPEGGYIVYADSKRYGTHAVMYETPKEEEARNWLREHNVPESGIKTRGMNPNDDAPRTHTAKSLSGFDSHRAERAERFSTINDLSAGEKQEVADMMTDIFSSGAYRMRSKDTFEEKFDTHFKGLLETGTSGGSTSKEGRRATGEKTFGHSRDIPAVEGEKYGYLGLEDDTEAAEDGTARWYGDTIFKFKKDAVKDRVTYTIGDTLDAGMPLAGYAGDKPTIEGISGLEYRGGTAAVRDILAQYRAYKRGDISFKDLKDTIQGYAEDGYIECHYHGKLTLDDVESITFPLNDRGQNWGIKKTFGRMSPEKRQKVVTYLKDRGIILQYYDSDGKLHDGYEYIEKEFGGDKK